MSASVLVLKPSSLGDIVHTLPAVAWMKEARPEWRISWLINTEWAPLLAGNSATERSILFPRRAFRGIGGVVPFAKWVASDIRPLRPDVAVDFQGLLRTAAIAKFSGAKSIFGLSDAREGARWFYNEVVRVPSGVPHAVERYMALAAKILENSGSECRCSALKYPLPPGSAPAEAQELGGDKFVLLHPFSRGSGKSLTKRQIQRVCQNLEPHLRVVIVGRGEESELPALSATCTSFLNRTDLSELIWLLRQAAFVVSVDSGPMHLAAALDKPLLSIHTWSDPRKVGPYRPDAWIWKSGRLFRFARRHEMPAETYLDLPQSLNDNALDEISSLVMNGILNRK